MDKTKKPRVVCAYPDCGVTRLDPTYEWCQACESDLPLWREMTPAEEEERERVWRELALHLGPKEQS